jgi:septum site-determining protein MinC
VATSAAYTSLVLKGTRHGLLASIREDADWSHIVSELSDLSTNGEGFLTDASITFDFGWREVSEGQFDQVISVLHQQGLSCNGILSTSLNTRNIAEDRGYRAIIGRLGLAKHQGRRLRREKEEGVPLEAASIQDVSKIKTPTLPPQSVENTAPPEKHTALVTEAEAALRETPETESVLVENSTEPLEPKVEESFEEVTSPSQEGVHVPRFQDEEPTLYLRKTLRSGQKVVFAGNVVLLGDLNPGAQIEADGDIIVMGQLRGTVHAGAEGDDSSTVIASSLRATQLRIADRFWEGEKNSSFFKKSTPTGTLRARLDGDAVVVEALPVR